MSDSDWLFIMTIVRTYSLRQGTCMLGVYIYIAVHIVRHTLYHFFWTYLNAQWPMIGHQRVASWHFTAILRFFRANAMRNNWWLTQMNKSVQYWSQAIIGDKVILYKEPFKYSHLFYGTFNLKIWLKTYALAHFFSFSGWFQIWAWHKNWSSQFLACFCSWVAKVPPGRVLEKGPSLQSPLFILNRGTDG